MHFGLFPTFVTYSAKPTYKFSKEVEKQIKKTDIIDTISQINCMGEMKILSGIPKIVIVVVTVLLSLLISFWWFKGGISSYLVTGGVKANPQGTIFIDKRSPLMVSLLINPEKLSFISKLIPANGEQKRILRAIEQFKQNLLTQAQVDSIDEISPWLGNEMTLSVTSLDLDRNKSNGVKPGYLLVVKNKDAQLAREFLQTYYAQQAVSQSAELIFEQYQGVNLVYQKPLLENVDIKQVAAAVIGDFVLFANDLPVLKSAINNAQAVDLNLAHDDAYKKAIASMNQPKISVAYLNLPATSAWIANQSEIEDNLIQQNLTVNLSLNPQGLITRTALYGIEGKENQPPNLSSPPNTLQYIPDDSVFAAVGTNLNQFWQQITSLPEKSPLRQIIYQTLNPIESNLDINFAEDIFAKVTGGYALSLAEDEMSDNLDWLFINEIQEQPLGEYLDNLAKNRGLSVGDLPLKNNTMTAWTKLVTTSKNNFASLSAQVKGVHTQTESYEFLTNSVDVLEETLSPKSVSFVDNSQFQATIKALPQNNDGYLYFDWQKLEPYIIKQFPVIKVTQLALKPLFDNLQTVTITSEGAENGIIRATIFWNLVEN